MTLIMLFEFIISMNAVYLAGRIGKDAQAAYGVVIQLYFIFVVIANSLNVGAVSVVSRLFTSDKENYHKAVSSSLILAVGLGLLFGLIGILFSGTIFSALNVPAEIKPIGSTLIRIYSIGILLYYFMISTNGVLRASKSVKKSLETMFVVCIVNILLSATLTFKTNLGINSIAIATVFADLIGCFINFFQIKKLIIKLNGFSKELIKKQIAIGWPMGLLQLAWQAGYMVLFLILSALPENRVEIIAAFTNGLRIESAMFLPAFAFNMAVAVIIGNFLGEGKTEDAFKSGLITAGVCVVAISVILIAVLLNAHGIAALLSDNEIVRRESVNYIYICLIVEPILAFGSVLIGALNGSGDTIGVMKIVIFAFWVVRIPLCYLFVVVLGYGAHAVWWCMNVSILFQTALITRRYLKKKWLSSSYQLSTEVAQENRSAL